MNVLPQLSDLTDMETTFSDLVLATSVKKNDILVVKKEPGTEETVWLGKVLQVMGNGAAKVEWITKNKDGEWAVDPAWAKQKVARNDILAKMKTWDGVGHMPDGLMDQLLNFYQQ